LACDTAYPDSYFLLKSLTAIARLGMRAIYQPNLKPI